MSSVSLPCYKGEELRHREVKGFAQGHLRLESMPTELTERFALGQVCNKLMVELRIQSPYLNSVLYPKEFLSG